MCLWRFVRFLLCVCVCVCWPFLAQSDASWTDMKLIGQSLANCSVNHFPLWRGFQSTRVWARVSLCVCVCACGVSEPTGTYVYIFWLPTVFFSVDDVSVGSLLICMPSHPVVLPPPDSVVLNKSAGSQSGSKSCRNSRIPSLHRRVRVSLSSSYCRGIYLRCCHRTSRSSGFVLFFCVLVPLQQRLHKVHVIHVLRNHKTESNPAVLLRKASVYRPVFTSRDKNNNSIILSANMKWNVRQ